MKQNNELSKAEKDYIRAKNALRKCKSKINKGYPQKRHSFFVEFGEYDTRQVNVHLGQKYNYWFIQPNEKDIMLLKGEIPEILKDKHIDKRDKIIVSIKWKEI